LGPEEVMVVSPSFFCSLELCLDDWLKITVRTLALPKILNSSQMTSMVKKISCIK